MNKFFLRFKSACGRCSFGLPIFIILLIIAGCRSCNENKPDLKIDVEDIPVSVKVLRLEKDLFAISPKDLETKLPDLKKKYGAVLNIFAQAINVENPDDSLFIFSIAKFINNPDMKTTATEVMAKYKDISKLEAALTDAMKHYSFYYPKKRIPKIFTCMSGYNYYIIPADSIMGISLEMYMGRDYHFYPKLQLPEYQTRNMTEDYIVPDFMKTLAFSQYPAKPDDMLGYMIYHGKVLYFLDAMLPDMNDTLKIGYTTKNMEWCQKNEKNIWKYLLSNKLIYTKDPTDIGKHIGDAPFTIPLGKSSAPRVGVWVGWQIVRTYMKNNSKVTLPQLMLEKNSQMILTKSKYKP
ncbi:MAG: hypothetical protein V2A54_16165 [Bacteroidota bacterium]